MLHTVVMNECPTALAACAAAPLVAVAGTGGGVRLVVHPLADHEPSHSDAFAPADIMLHSNHVSQGPRRCADITPRRARSGSPCYLAPCRCAPSTLLVTTVSTPPRQTRSRSGTFRSSSERANPTRIPTPDILPLVPKGTRGQALLSLSHARGE